MSGTCVCRETVKKQLEARELADQHDQRRAEREAGEMLNEAGRLFAEQDTHFAGKETARDAVILEEEH